MEYYWQIYIAIYLVVFGDRFYNISCIQIAASITLNSLLPMEKVKFLVKQLKFLNKINPLQINNNCTQCVDKSNHNIMEIWFKII